MATNKVVYGNTTLIDLTSDTVDASHLHNGYTAHDRSGTAITGSYVAPTITQITPSNASPVSMSANTAYEPTTSGYAIESYENLIPSNSDPQTIEIGEIYKATNNGKAVASVTDVTPSNSSPREIYSSGIYRPTSTGWVIASLLGITPSNDSPKILSIGEIYKILNNSGILIQSYTNVTPSAEGAAFSAGFVKMSSGGYAYDTRPSSGPASGTGTFTSTSQEVSISTGVSSISHFVIHIYPHTASSNDITSFATWDSNYSSYYYSSALYTATATQGARRAVGTAQSGAYLIGIMSVSGGTVSIKGPSNANGLGTYVWFAY